MGNMENVYQSHQYRTHLRQESFRIPSANIRAIHCSSLFSDQQYHEYDARKELFTKKARAIEHYHHQHRQ